MGKATGHKTSVRTLAVLIQSDALRILLEHRYAIACSGMYVDRAYNGNITAITGFFLPSVVEGESLVRYVGSTAYTPLN